MPPDEDDALLSVKRKASVCEVIQVICLLYRRLPKLPSLKTRTMQFRRASTNSERIRLVECCCSSPDSCLPYTGLNPNFAPGHWGTGCRFLLLLERTPLRGQKGLPGAVAGRSSAMNPLLKIPGSPPGGFTAAVRLYSTPPFPLLRGRGGFYRRESN